MKVKELAELFNHPRMERIMDDDVVIELSEPSIGPIAMVEVKSAFQGFDWESGKFIIHPSEPVVRRTENQALWQAARDLLFMLSAETRHYKGEERLTSLAKEVRLLFERFGLRPRKVGTFIPEGFE